MSSEKLLITTKLATLIIVTIGVTFAAFQVRQGTWTRRLQAISALWVEIWPPEASQA
jgi:hypothetical protein